MSPPASMGQGQITATNIRSATGWYFLEPLIYANVPAFLWLGYYGLRIAAEAKRMQPGSVV